MCEWVLERGEYIKGMLSHFPKVPRVSGEHLGGNQNGDDQRIIGMIHGSLHPAGQYGVFGVRVGVRWGPAFGDGEGE